MSRDSSSCLAESGYISTYNNNNNINLYKAHTPAMQIKVLYNTNMHTK